MTEAVDFFAFDNSYARLPDRFFARLPGRDLQDRIGGQLAHETASFSPVSLITSASWVLAATGREQMR
jgi:hypothetical protein